MHETHNVADKSSFDSCETVVYYARTFESIQPNMFSQSIFAQLLRMTVLLVITLVAVHHYQPLLNLLAEQAVNSGCHQQTKHKSHLHSHHH